MTNYLDPSRWAILQYRPGAGGKMLMLCLMTIDKVAHWDPEVETGVLTHEESLSKYWNPQSIAGWVVSEPVVHWHSKFYSRSYPRGDAISVDEYNHLMNIHSDDYFKYCWKSGKIILDYLHKPQLPSWHHGSMLLKLDADKHDPYYRETLLSKLYPWDPNTKIGTSLLDHPNFQPSTSNVLKFNNQYEFGPFESVTQWLEFVWSKYSTINFKITNPDLQMPDLFQFDKIESLISSVADDLDSTYNVQALRATYEYWLGKHTAYIYAPVFLPVCLHFARNLNPAQLQVSTPSSSVTVYSSPVDPVTFQDLPTGLTSLRGANPTVLGTSRNLRPRTSSFNGVLNSNNSV